MKVLAVIVIICVLSDGLSSSSIKIKQLMADEWNGFKLGHQKVYRSLKEEQYRFNVYLKNRDFIAKHNERYALGLETYTVGVNHLADMTHEEILLRFAGFNTPVPNPSDLGNDDAVQWMEDDTTPRATFFDWREKRTLNPVKNQLSCGSCWAFAVLTAIEHHLQIHQGVKLDLSEQQLVDCTRMNGNNGCGGGWFDPTYKYIMASGSAKESDYGYEAVNGQCRYNSNMRAASIRGFQNVKGVANMQQALENVGPLAVAIYVSQGFSFYKSGVLNEPGCPKSVNHAVVIVGHGQQDNDEYWIVQNSWGQEWGDKGYILMSKNRNSQCGIEDYPSYPVV